MSLDSSFPAIAVRSVPTHITAKYQHTKMLSNSSLVSQYGPTGDKMTLVNKLVTTHLGKSGSSIRAVSRSPNVYLLKISSLSLSV